MNTKASVSPNSAMAVHAHTTSSERFGRTLVDLNAERFKLTWHGLARRSRLSAPMLHHPVAQALLLREREVTARGPQDKSADPGVRPINTQTFSSALARFDRYCAANFEGDIAAWRRVNGLGTGADARPRPRL